MLIIDESESNTENNALSASVFTSESEYISPRKMYIYHKIYKVEEILSKGIISKDTYPNFKVSCYEL